VGPVACNGISFPSLAVFVAGSNSYLQARTPLPTAPWPASSWPSLLGFSCKPLHTLQMHKKEQEVVSYLYFTLFSALAASNISLGELI